MRPGSFAVGRTGPKISAAVPGFIRAEFVAYPPRVPLAKQSQNLPKPSLMGKSALLPSVEFGSLVAMSFQLPGEVQITRQSQV
jgi:hypothetical protein